MITTRMAQEKNTRWMKMETGRLISCLLVRLLMRLTSAEEINYILHLYQKNGFRIAGWGGILLQSFLEEDQDYLECALQGKDLNRETGQVYGSDEI